MSGVPGFLLARGRSRTSMAVVAAVTLAVSVLPVLPVLAAQPASAAAEPPRSASSSVEDDLLAEYERAGEQAAMTGKPVPVRSLTTETDQVLAMPKGGFERESFAEQVRTLKDGRWRDVDTTLIARADGTVAPKVTGVDLEFSGGGSTQPLAQVGHDGVEVSLGWDMAFWGRALPKPELSGDTARYREVVDGVDLDVKATATGFRQVLVVKNAEAARNPKLRTLHFGQQVDGGRVEKKEKAAGEQPAGEPAESTLEVIDEQGDVVFVGNASKMWDSSGAVPDERRESTVAEDDDQQAVMAVDVDADSVEITPDQELLTGADTEYPVFIDPDYRCTTCGTRDDYLVVYEKNDNIGDSAWNNDDENLLKVGHVHDVRARSYFDFDISDIPTSATITSARLDLTVNNSYYPDCRGTTSVYFTSYINSSMYWGNEPTKGWGVDGGGYVGSISSGNKPSNSSECTGNWHAIGAVTAGVQDLRRAGRTQATFGLYASTYASETDWRRFTTNPGLLTKFSLPPRAPSSITVFNDTVSKGCSGSVNKTWVAKGVVDLKAKISNPSVPPGTVYDNAPGWVRAEFAVRRNGEAEWDYHTSKFQPPGQTHEWTLPSTYLEEGHLEWRVRAEDSDYRKSVFVGSAVNESCIVMIDRVAPSTPDVVSTDYPSADETDPASGGVGVTGTFAVTPGTPTGYQGSVDVSYYGWSLVPGKFDHKVPANTKGEAKIAVTPTEARRTLLYVKGFDRAGNVSVDPRIYSFKVAPGAGPKGSWDFEGNGADSAGQATSTLRAGAGFGAGFVEQGLKLSGATNSYAQTSGSATPDTSKSFSVSAWTRLDAKDHDGVAVSQEGTRVSRYKLNYLSSTDRWAFSLYSSAASPAITRLSSKAAPKLGKWTHVAGTYDVGTRKARLYVDGKLQQELAVTDTPWHAGQGITTGAGMWNGALSGFFEGGIDQVRAYDRLLTSSDVANLANQAVERSRYKLEEDYGVTAADSVNDYDGTVSRLAASSNNLVSNPGLESWTDGAPGCVETNGWGENTHTLGQVAGRTGHGAQLNVSAHTDGLRHVGTAWADCAPSVAAGKSYDVSLWYRSDTDEVSLDLFTQGADGTWTWWETGTELWAAADWTKASVTTPPVPDGVQRIAAALTLKGVGTATVDDYRTVLSNDGSENETRPGSVAWDEYGPGAIFDGWGADQNMGDISSPLPGTVSSEGSFTMAAFVRHDGFDSSARQGVSLSGSRYMPVGLGYRASKGRWAATLVTGTQSAPVAEHILSDAPAAETVDADGWVHLAFTYDAARGVATFYVNGVPQGTTIDLASLPEPELVLTRPLAADAGRLVIGRGTWVWAAGNKADPWKGAVRDVRLASGVACLPVIGAWSEGGDGIGDCDGGEE